MERFRDLTIQCDDEYAALMMLEIIKQACNEPPFVNYEEYEALCNYKQKPSASKEMQENRIVNQKQDNTIVRIVSTYKNTTKAKLILRAKRSVIEVVNIIPYESKPGGISIKEYNIIIEAFKSLVVDKIDVGNKVELSSPELSLETMIPQSYGLFINWVEHVIHGDNAPFEESLSLCLWYDFLISLRTNNEYNNLSTSDLELCLKALNLKGPLIQQTISHYKNDLPLLDYQISKLKSEKQMRSLTQTVKNTIQEEEPIEIMDDNKDMPSSRMSVLHELDNEIKINTISDDFVKTISDDIVRRMLRRLPAEYLYYNEQIELITKKLYYYRDYEELRHLLEAVGIQKKSFLYKIGTGIDDLVNSPIMIFNWFNNKPDIPEYYYKKNKKYFHRKGDKYIVKTGTQDQIVLLPVPSCPIEGEETTLSSEKVSNVNPKQ